MKKQNFTAVKAMVAVITLMVLSIFSVTAQKQKAVQVGGAAMYPSKNIVENAVNSMDHTTLVAAVKAAGLVETLQGDGPFTVFAPTNMAFNKLPKGTVDALLQPENKASLTQVLTYHVVPGKISSSQLMKLIGENKGAYSAKTVQGNSLHFKVKGKNIMVEDEKGSSGLVTIKDVNQSNGVIHVINTVMLPEN